MRFDQILWAAVFLAAINLSASEPATLKKGFFIANDAHTVTQKRLLMDSRVVAFTKNSPLQLQIMEDAIAILLPESTAEANSKTAPSPTFTFKLPSNPAKNSKVTLDSPLSAKVNLLYGPKTNWRPGITVYERVRYDNLLPGVNLSLNMDERDIRYRLELSESASLNQLKLQVGTGRLSQDQDGTITIESQGHRFQIKKPNAYRLLNHKQIPVDVQIKVHPSGGIYFESSEFKTGINLVIEPVVEWLTYITPKQGNWLDLFEVAYDASDNIFIAGCSNGNPEPEVNIGFDTSYNQGYGDGYVVGYQVNGQPRFKTFLGGTNFDQIKAMKILSNGQILVGGATSSNDFPTTPGTYDLGGSPVRGFLSILSNDGTQLLQSTKLPFAVEDLALDSMNNVYITGTAFSGVTMTSNAFMATASPQTNIYTAKISNDFSTILHSTYIADASSKTYGLLISVDDSGNSYIVGRTLGGFPTTAGVHAPDPQGAWVSLKVNHSGSELIYATFIAPNTYAVGDMLLDEQNRVTLLGTVSGTGLATTMNARDTTYNGGYDGFLCTFNSDATGFDMATYLGSNQDEYFGALHRTDDGRLMVAGSSASTDLEVTPNAYQMTNQSVAPNRDSYLIIFNESTMETIYATYFGGPDWEYFHKIAVSGETGNILLGGGSYDMEFLDGEPHYQDAHTDSFIIALNIESAEIEMQRTFKTTSDIYHPKIAQDSQDNIYIYGNSGVTNSLVTDGAYFNAGDYEDIFIYALSQDGENLLYATYIGGDGNDYVSDMAIDSQGNLYLTGDTDSSDFPLTTGSPTTDPHIFAMKLTQNGSSLGYSRLLHRTRSTDDDNTGDFDKELSVLADGSLIVAGNRNSCCSNSYQRLFTTKLDTSGDVVFDNDISSIGQNRFFDMATDTAGNIILVGNGAPSNLPTTMDAIEPNYAANAGYLLKFAADGTTVQYATYLHDIHVEEVAVDSQDAIVVVGNSFQNTVPTTANAFQQTYNGSGDVVVMKLNSSHTPAFISYLGGGDEEGFPSLAVDDEDNIHVGGFIYGNFLAGTANETTGIEEQDLFYAVLDPTGSQLISAKQLGTTGWDLGYSISAKTINSAYMLAYTELYSESPLTPGTPGTYGENSNVTPDLALFKIECGPPELGEPTALVETCPGLPINLQAPAANSGAMAYQWFFNGFLLQSETHPSLYIANPTFGAQGLYEVEVSSACGTTRSSPIELVTSSPIAFEVPTQGVGLNIPTFNLMRDCDIPGGSLVWEVSPEVNFEVDGDVLSFPQTPNQSVQIRVRYMASGFTYGETTGQLLVTQAKGYDDFNGDGCNDLQDMLDFSQEWGFSRPDDPNGDGLVNMLDLLYIPIDPNGCPE